MRKVVFLLVVLVCSTAAFGQGSTEGSLYAVGKQGNQLGACPLKTTSVKADISGFLSRVRVRQEFENSYTEPIEAVYVFPLSQNGAVDDMTMTIGERVIRGKIMRREEARTTYEAAKSEGKTASLLDQERPNIFTQSVANIMPGESVIIEISYVETLKYEDGSYEFVFPMTVAPRYMPAGVKDAARIKPPVARGRAGHDISIEINLNAGVPVEGIRSSSHRIDQVNYSPSASKITLRGGKTIPNKDFVLRYDVTGGRIEDAMLTHRDEHGGFFTMILQPPDRIATEDRTPKEIVFVLDTSGSMSGFPIEKAKEAMSLSLDGLYPDDTFNLITFAGDTQILFDGPVPATRANLDRAQAFLAGREGSGGTEMMTAIKAALDPSDAADHLRIVCFMTDGEVGNDDEIIAEIQRHPNARVFSFGIGKPVNRSLLDRVAKEGKGEAEYVALEDDGSKAAKKFYERVRSPLITDIVIDWNGMPVADTYPDRVPDLFSAKPVIVHGRYTKAGSGTIKLRGKIAGQPYERDIAVQLPDREPANDVLSTLWARTRIDDLSSQSLKSANSEVTVAFDGQITNIGLEFGLLTQFTSFVAVEERIVNQNGAPVTIQVPVELPDGVNRRTTLGDDDAADNGGGGGGRAVGQNAPVKGAGKHSGAIKRRAKNNVAYSSVGRGQGSGAGSGSGNGVGSGMGYGNGSATLTSPPPNASVQALVDVSGGVVELVDQSSTQITTTVSAQAVEMLPKGVNFTTIMKLAPGTYPQARSGQFQIDGASGPENTFVIDGTEVGGEGAESFGRAVRVVRPNYNAAARARRIRGEVEVDIRIDTRGAVSTATAISGNPLLRRSAERAAMLSTFSPFSTDGKALAVTGSIIYNFRSARTVTVSLRNMKAVEPSAADSGSAAIDEKLHFWLTAVVRRVQSGTTKPDPLEAKFIHDQKADIQIDLTERSPAIIEKLKRAGFELVSEKGKSMVMGRVALDKIAALARIEEVKLILPRI